MDEQDAAGVAELRGEVERPRAENRRLRALLGADRARPAVAERPPTVPAWEPTLFHAEQAAAARSAVDGHSSPEAKIALFRSLFAGRDDVGGRARPRRPRRSLHPRWTVNPPPDRDEASMTVTCREGDLSGDGATAFWVVPSGFVPSATLPPELLGTWVLEWAIQEQAGCSPPEPCPSVTFILGSCALGERCGSLIQANKPGCRFPLVFHRNSAPGDFILNAGGDDTAGCDEGWGTGLHFVPTAEGTVRLYTRDGTNVILHRVGPAPTPSAAP
jgi:hypothetical protein